MIELEVLSFMIDSSYLTLLTTDIEWNVIIIIIIIIIIALQLVYS